MYGFIIIKYLKINQKKKKKLHCRTVTTTTIVVVMYVGVDAQCVYVVVGFLRDCAFVAQQTAATVVKSSLGSVQTIKQVADLISYFDG